MQIYVFFKALLLYTSDGSTSGSAGGGFQMLYGMILFIYNEAVESARATAAQTGGRPEIT